MARQPSVPLPIPPNQIAGTDSCSAGRSTAFDWRIGSRMVTRGRQPRNTAHITVFILAAWLHGALILTHVM